MSEHQQQWHSTANTWCATAMLTVAPQSAGRVRSGCHPWDSDGGTRSHQLEYEPLPVDDPTRRRPDISLARGVLGWEPRIELRDGLARTAEWLRSVGG